MRYAERCHVAQITGPGAGRRVSGSAGGTPALPDASCPASLCAGLFVTSGMSCRRQFRPLTEQECRHTLTAVLSQHFSGGARGSFSKNSPRNPPINLPCVVRVEGGESGPVIKTTQRVRVGVFRSCLHWKTEPRPRLLARNHWGNGASAVTAKVGQSFRKRSGRIHVAGAFLLFGKWFAGKFRRGREVRCKQCPRRESNLQHRFRKPLVYR